MTLLLLEKHENTNFNDDGLGVSECIASVKGPHLLEQCRPWKTGPKLSPEACCYSTSSASSLLLWPYTRWAPTSYKWSYTHCKWPKIYGYLTEILLKTGRGPSCIVRVYVGNNEPWKNE